MNDRLINKVGCLLSCSALGLILADNLHASELSNRQSTIEVAYVEQTTAKASSMAINEAFKRGMQLASRARKPREHVMAYEYLNYAANQGMAEAQFQCALIILDDQFVPGTEEDAITLLKKASAQGHQQAKIALSYVVEAGDGGFGC